jgi:hypothetical protein
VKTVRCTTCREEFSHEELEGVTCCPSCGSIGVPMAIADDVEITINWHELRILGMWASNWAGAHFPATDSAKGLAMILHAISVQHPELSTRMPLTLAGELGNLRRAIEDGEIEGVSEMETNVRDMLAEPDETPPVE